MSQKYNPSKTRYLHLINPMLKLVIHEKNLHDKIKPENIRNVVIVDVSLIGDEIMNIPFYKSIRDIFKDTKVTVVGKPWLRVQLENQHLIDKFIEFDGLSLLATPMTWLKNRKLIKKTIKEINKETYDLAFELRGDVRYILFMHFIKSVRKISYNYMNADYMLTDSVEPDASIKHEVDLRLHLLEALGFSIENSNRFPELKLTKGQIDNNQQFCADYGLINKIILGIHPGASLDIKRYKHYKELVRHVISLIKNKDDYAFIVFCGYGEEEIAVPVYQEIKEHGCLGILSKESLKDYISRIAICDYMICNDSGAGHLAAAYGIPVTVFFGPINPDIYKPKGLNQVNVVSHNLNCKPCNHPYCRLGTRDCIDGISVEEGLEAVISMMNLKINFL